MRKIKLLGNENIPIYWDAYVTKKVQQYIGGSVGELKDKLQDPETIAYILSLLINEAVQYKKIFEHEDITETLPAWPIDERVVAMMLRDEDLYQNADLAEAIVDELIENIGMKKKDLTEMAELMESIMPNSPQTEMTTAAAE